MTSAMYTSVSNYKKALKKLREIDKLKTKTNLTSDEMDKLGKEKYYKEIIKIQNKTNITFDSLPDDTVNIIIEYLPYNTRVAILRNKYPNKIIETKLEKMVVSIETNNKLYICAKICEKMLYSILPSNSQVLQQIPSYISSGYSDDKKYGLYLHYYKDKFSKIILTTLHHYTKMYKNKNHNTDYVKFEKVVLKIFAHLVHI
jgi:hypothetical protein